MQEGMEDVMTCGIGFSTASSFPMMSYTSVPSLRTLCISVSQATLSLGGCSGGSWLAACGNNTGGGGGGGNNIGGGGGSGGGDRGVMTGSCVEAVVLVQTCESAVEVWVSKALKFAVTVRPFRIGTRCRGRRCADADLLFDFVDFSGMSNFAVRNVP
eukprot:Lankesteria_metandrocarpae@DN5454_c2_g1_i6.p2